MKYSPNQHIPGDVAIYNGAETASSHAVKADETATYLAAGFKFACPAHAVNCLTEIVDAGYTDKGWADFMLWVPAFTKYIGFEFRAIGSGTLTISTPDEAANKNDIQIEVSNPPYSGLNGTEFSANGGGLKGYYMDRMEDAGQWFMNGPAMPVPDTSNMNRAIIVPFKRYPDTLYVRVVAENDASSSGILYVLPFQFYFYPPDATLDLTDATAV